MSTRDCQFFKNDIQKGLQFWISARTLNGRKQCTVKCFLILMEESSVCPVCLLWCITYEKEKSDHSSTISLAESQASSSNQEPRTVLWLNQEKGPDGESGSNDSGKLT